MSILNRRIVMTLGALAILAGPATAQGLSGSYKAEGRNPDGSAYRGVVQLTHSANVVSMAWSVGNSSYIGTGVQDGRVITVNWGADTPVVYVVMPDGSLHGTWANGAALEKLTPN
ncbi:hypothetical protein [Tateyamaria sp. SN3-11]|uniref:LIC10280 family protein n=1 Tax=Tateyamaria sp. SN3-11 TaxID=3092147 RepID=UPI0039EB2815